MKSITLPLATTLFTELHVQFQLRDSMLQCQETRLSIKRPSYTEECTKLSLK